MLYKLIDISFFYAIIKTNSFGGVIMKSNLPVIVLRGIVLLPNNDLRLEFDNDNSKNLIDIAELFHDGTLLVVSDPYIDGDLQTKDLPKIGVISKIVHKLELPNGKIRIVINGIKRANVFEYLNNNSQTEVLESIISEIDEVFVDKTEEEAIIKKLYKEIENYSKIVPDASNSVLSLIINNDSLEKITDIIVRNLSLKQKRLYEYLKEINCLNRAQMILEDIYKEQDIFQIEKNIDVKVKKQLDDTQKEFILREKMKQIKDELGESSIKDSESIKLKEKINSLDCPIKIKERLNIELNKYESSSSMSPEINIIRNYIECLINLPWNNFTKDNEDLKNVRSLLDESHYGLDKVKERIIEYLAVKKMTNNLNSPILCLVGPPGVGKTSLAFSIAQAINRNFVKISVGGINDEAEIKGHRRAYIGASPGRIMESMKKAGSCNPVFLIDEIDKMTKDIKGDPASVLLDILDPEQNKFFSDNYIEEDYDLSNVMFIATANYIDKIPEALKDRLEIIELTGYTEYEKLDIVKKHLLPNILKEHGLNKSEINISFNDNIILEIIRNYTRESGVRELKRQVSNIIRKIVTKIVMENLNVTNIVIKKKDLITYLGHKKFQYNENTLNEYPGIVNGLAYTSYGGDTLPIEVNFYKGKGELSLTGSLGNVMKESASIALSYIKANYKEFNIDYDMLVNNDIHIHVPEGAIKKDGPSAGIALTTALISAFTNKKVDNIIALTGEITLTGKVLPIGGLKEKSIGAYRSGIKTIIIPDDNISDLEEIPKEIKNNIKYIPVKDYKEVYNFITK